MTTVARHVITDGRVVAANLSSDITDTPVEVDLLPAPELTARGSTAPQP